MRATIKDIAKRVGVSSSLVSLYLNNRPLAARIAESTKRKIDAAVKELNYAPSATARALRKGKSKTLGLVVADLCSDYSSFFAQTLLDECSRYGYQLLIGITHYDPEEEKRVLANLIARQTDGIFYALRLFPADFLKSLNLQNYPILQLGSASPEFQSTGLAVEEPVRQCAAKLHAIGCRRVLIAHESWAKILEKEGIDLTVVDVCAIQPCDMTGITQILSENETIFTVEEHSTTGGLGSMIAEIASEACPRFVHRIGMFGYAESASAETLLHEYQLDGEGVAAQIRGYLSK